MGGGPPDLINSVCRAGNRRARGDGELPACGGSTAKGMNVMGLNNSNILLETGTNEIEIMEFTIDENLFGINVAKVREIMMVAPVKPMQNANQYVEGIFKPRDKVLTVINLGSYLNLGDSEKPDRDIFIIAGFNSSEYAFHVHTVVGIARISCTQMRKPPRQRGLGQARGFGRADEAAGLHDAGEQDQVVGVQGKRRHARGLSRKRDCRC